MPRIISPARTASPARRLVLPAGIKGSASLWFDPTDDCVTGTNPISGSQAFTVLAWARKEYRAANYPLAVVLASAGAGGFYMGGDGSGGHTLYMNLPGVIGAATTFRIDDGPWHRIGARFAGGTAKIQALGDGAQRGQSAGTGTPNISGTSAWLSYAPLSWAGNLCDVRVYSRYLSDAEVAADNRGEWVDPTGLVRRWTCENPGYGTTCHEEIGNTDDPIRGALWSPSVPFRRRRIVEDVAAAVKGDDIVTTSVPASAVWQPALASFSFGFWYRDNPGGLGVRKPIRCFGTGSHNWMIYQLTATHTILLRFMDGAGVSADAGDLTTPQFGGDGRWRHIVGGIDRATGQVLLYVDAGRPLVGAVGALGTVLPDGALWFAESGLVFGAMNDAAIWNGRMISWDEIDAWYYDGVMPAAGSATRVSWGMREGAGLTVASSPAGYDGVLSFESWTTATRSHARSAA